MNHLKTDKERKARWYVNDESLTPTYAQVITSNDDNPNDDMMFQNSKNETIIQSIPASWFHQNRQQQQQQHDDEGRNNIPARNNAPSRIRPLRMPRLL
mmetsp:Transcript_8059/g.11466  ORF Transcript_8059/g.11466 Transcript_8059/m.11466 type:complete len:98 (-) Transcript_8059:974-1267(-)